MGDWTNLSKDEINDITQKLTAALKYLGIKSATARWNVPGALPHWQLIIESSWCERQSRSDVLGVRDQAMERADIQAPIDGVILKSHEKQRRK